MNYCLKYKRVKVIKLLYRTHILSQYFILLICLSIKDRSINNPFLTSFLFSFIPKLLNLQSCQPTLTSYSINYLQQYNFYASFHPSMLMHLKILRKKFLINLLMPVSQFTKIVHKVFQLIQNQYTKSLFISSEIKKIYPSKFISFDSAKTQPLSKRPSNQKDHE